MRIVLGILLLQLLACDSLWSPFDELNPDACRNGGTLCAPGWICDPTQRQCLIAAPDSGTPDGGTPSDGTPAVLSAVTPALGPTTGGIMLRLDGQSFADGAMVSIADTAATPVSVLSEASLTVTLPAHPGVFGKVPVAVKNPGAAAVSRDDLFAYYPGYLVFPNQQPHTGTRPTGVAVADFNGDRNLDFAVSNQGSNSVSVFLGTGLGSFNAAVNYTTASSPAGVAVGDFNGDQKPDLVVANGGNNSVSVLLGTGTGSFAGVTNFAAGTNPSSVTVGDFNADQKLDLVVTNQSTSSVSVLLGNGAGNFGAPATAPAGANPSSVAVGDFNGDQRPDLAVTNTTAGVSVLLASGTGSFGAPTSYSAGMSPRTVAVGDVNGV